MAARHRLSGVKKPDEIGRLLLAWYARGHRDLPWRNTRDPYTILVSEIMLQQTRAQAVIPYYRRFLERFPTVTALAAAAEDDVLALWSGLGYYSRARNLRLAAQRIDAAGGFPRDYDSIRALPGIGDYTAAAVGSIAFDLPFAVLDGNVLRVVARVTNDTSDISSGRTRERFREVAQQWLDLREPGLFNQALMELGATVCLPRAPHCAACPVSLFCEAYKTGRQRELPVKRSPPAALRLLVQVAVVEKKGLVLLRQRSAGASLMPGFWELPAPEDLPGWRAGKTAGTFRHTITNHLYTITVLSGKISRIPAGFRWRRRNLLTAIPLTTISRKALRLSISD
jgi:A/G-specific adenine glycosylase